MEDKKLVVIIILNYNNKTDTLISLESVSKLTYSPFEIVLVDNGSHDNFAEEIKLKYPRVNLIESKKNLGVAGGRNLAIKYANKNFDYNFLFFLDNDITIKPDTLSEMISSFNLDYKIGIVSPKCYVSNTLLIKYAGGMSVNFFTGIINDIGGGEIDKGQFNESGFVAAAGGLCLINKTVIDKIKCFDEKFNPYGWEDIDFSIRARKAGFKILYNPKAIIYHKGGKKGRGNAIKEYEFSKSKNYFYLVKKHANVFQLIIFGIILPFKALLIVIKEISFGEFKTLSAQFRGFLTLFK